MMNLIKDKQDQPCPVFNEDTTIYQLFIEAEMESKTEFEKIKTQLPKCIRELYDEKTMWVDFFDYIVADKDVSKNDIGASVTIDLAINIDSDEIETEKITFAEYVELIEFRVIDEKDGVTEEWNFPLTAKGFLDALKKYNSIIRTK